MAREHGQETHSLRDLDHFPPTVEGHTEQSDGLTLHTIENDPDSDLEVYNDNREMHRADALDEEDDE